MLNLQCFLDVLSLNPFMVQKVLSAFEQGSEKGNSFRRNGRSHTVELQGAEPIQKFGGSRRFLKTLLPQMVKDGQGRIHQRSRYLRVMQPDNLTHLFHGGEGDVVAVAATEERVGKLPFGVAGNYGDRHLRRLHLVVDLADDKRAVLQYVQEIVLGVRVGLVNLVQQENASVFGKKSSADWAESQVIPDVVDITAAPPRLVREGTIPFAEIKRYF